MIKLLKLDDTGLAPDPIFINSNTLRVAYGHVDGIKIFDLDLNLNILSTRILTDGFYNSFPRLYGQWIGYKSQDPYYIKLLNLDTNEVITFARGEGNEPCAFGNGVFVYQTGVWDIHRYIITDRRELELMINKGAPDGIGIYDSVVTLVKDMHSVYPYRGKDIARFDFSGPFTAGENIRDEMGALVKYNDYYTLLWSGQETMWPKCDSYGNLVTVATWGKEGIRIALVDVDYIQSNPYVIPVPPPPEIDFTLNKVEAYAPCIITGKLNKKVNIAPNGVRWLKDGNIDQPVTEDTHDYQFSIATESNLSIRARGTNGTDITTPIQKVKILAPVKPSFYKGLQTGFRAPIGSDIYRLVKSWGWELARLDVMTLGREQIKVMCDEVLSEGLVPLLITTADQIPLCPDNSFIEVYADKPDPTSKGTEPDIRVPPLDQYVIADAITKQMLYARVHNQTIMAGCISNTSASGLNWLAKLVPMLLADIWITVHRYPPLSPPKGNSNWSDPREGFSTRQAEVDRLKSIVGNRVWGVSEGGWSTGKYKVWWFWTKTVFQQTQADNEQKERAFWKAQGARFYVKYQIRDGAEAKDGGPGIIDYQGKPKVAAKII